MIYGDDDLISRNSEGKLISLNDGQFDISGTTFGGTLDSILLDSFDPGEPGWDTQDADNPFGNNTLFGRDYLHSPTWSFEGFTNGYDIDDSLAAVEEISRIWRAESLKESNNSFQILRYRIGSRTRRVYGRGRKFWHALDRRTYSGTAPISMSFKLMTNTYFDDEANSVILPIMPSTIGGLTAPLVSPITTFGVSVPRFGVIEKVGGTVPTPFHLYIHGPVSNPYVEGSGFKIRLNMDIASDQIIHISTYAGMLEVVDNFGSNFAGRLSSNTRLNNARLNPGSANLSFGGADVTNTAWAQVVWRSAYSTL